jgi:hypothetical protein
MRVSKTSLLRTDKRDRPFSMLLPLAVDCHGATARCAHSLKRGGPIAVRSMPSFGSISEYEKCFAKIGHDL